MLDKSIPYHSIIMKRSKGSRVPDAVLPKGYSFVLYSEGDEQYWAEIETSVGEFDSTQKALDYFKVHYSPYLEETKRRLLFIKKEDNQKIATLTNWWNYTNERRDPAMHWVSVNTKYQGLGLGKAIVFEGLARMLKIEGDRDIYLHTQTWSYKAINIYLKAGFKLVEEESFGGYNNDYKKAIEFLKGKVNGLT